MVVPRVVEPVVILVVAHQEQTVLVQLPVEGAAIGQGPVVAAGHGLEVQRRPEHHRQPLVDVGRAELGGGAARLVHHLEGVRRARGIQGAAHGLADAGRIAAVAGVVVGVAGVDIVGVGAPQDAVLLPEGRVGKVPLDEGVGVHMDPHRTQSHHGADALAAVDPALGLVDIGGQNDFFHGIPPARGVTSVKTGRFVV